MFQIGESTLQRPSILNVIEEHQIGVLIIKKVTYEHCLNYYRQTNLDLIKQQIPSQWSIATLFFQQTPIKSDNIFKKPHTKYLNKLLTTIYIDIALLCVALNILYSIFCAPYAHSETPTLTVKSKHKITAAVVYGF